MESPQPTTGRLCITRDRRGPWLQLLTPRNFEWNLVHLPVPNLAPPLHGLRVLQISDLHLRPRWWHATDELLARIQRDPPDLLVITGDFIDHKWEKRSALPNVERFVDGLRARIGVYAILGNHDGDLLAPRLAAKLHLVNGSVVVVEHCGVPIEIIGLPCVTRRELDDAFLRALPPKLPGQLRIVLSHYPDHLPRVLPLKPELLLAGHTHGGQVCLPGGIPIIRHDRLPRSMCRGIHRVEQTWLVVNRGFGFATLPIRLFCPAEVIELTLVPAR